MNHINPEFLYLYPELISKKEYDNLEQIKNMPKIDINAFSDPKILFSKSDYKIDTISFTSYVPINYNKKENITEKIVHEMNMESNLSSSSTQDQVQDKPEKTVKNICELNLHNIKTKYIERYKNFKIRFHDDKLKCRSFMTKNSFCRYDISEFSQIPFLEGIIGIIKNDYFIELDKCCDNCNVPLVEFKSPKLTFDSSGYCTAIIRVNYTKKHSGSPKNIIGFRLVIQESGTNIYSNCIILPFKHHIYKKAEINKK